MTTKRERLVNNARTTLASAVSIAASTISVTSAAGFPTDGNFRILVNSEIMLVTAVSGTTFTVTKGVEATSDAAHAAGDGVFAITTAESLRQIVADDLLYANNVPLYNSLTNDSGAVLTVSSFTWLNQSTATAVDVDGTIYMQIPSGAGENIRGLHLAAPTPPYTVTVGIRPLLVQNAAGTDGFPQFTLGFRDSGTSRISHMPVSLRDGSYQVQVNRHTTESSYNSSTISNRMITFGPDVWMRVTDNNTNHIFQVSTDGKNWTTMVSEVRTSWTASPNQVLMALNAAGNTTSTQQATIFHYSIT